MSHIGNIKIVVLWEHEIVAAAKALECIRRKEATADEIKNAIMACMAALYSPELISDEYCITIMKIKDFKK